MALMRTTVNGSPVSSQTVDQNMSLLDFLREILNLKGTKQGCGSGDCGACTVIVKGSGNEDSAMAINACITPAAAMQNKHVITVEGLADRGSLHPVQQALIDHHGSQCGFCTPGFVMALAAHSLKSDAPKKCDREHIIAAISGNLCRCTGYWPIVRAGMAACGVGEAAQLKHIQTEESQKLSTEPREPDYDSGNVDRFYEIPQDEIWVGRSLVQRAANKGFRPTIIAGATDAWVAVNQQLEQHETIVDISHIPSLRKVTTKEGLLHIGSCVTHTELLNYFTEAPHESTAMRELLTRFGSPQIRNRGTIGGNICGGSPIADWPPVLLALDGSVLLKNAEASRLVNLTDFFLGYRQTCLLPDEYLASVQFKVPADWSQLSFNKITKRYEDDISSVCAAIYLDYDGTIVREARIAFGGIAATPVRLDSIEALLIGKPLSAIDHEMLKIELGSVIDPISDVRASADYRLQMAETLLLNRLSSEQMID